MQKGKGDHEHENLPLTLISKLSGHLPKFHIYDRKVVNIYGGGLRVCKQHVLIFLFQGAGQKNKIEKRSRIALSSVRQRKQTPLFRIQSSYLFPKLRQLFVD